MGYEDAPATKMLARFCGICGRPLVDAKSVEAGIGPICRDGFDGEMTEAIRIEANKLIYQASLAFQGGNLPAVEDIIDSLEELGLESVPAKIKERLVAEVNASEDADIIITEDNGFLKVKTPFRRGRKDEFVQAWRSIPGRRYLDNKNVVPVLSKVAVWLLLIDFFPGKRGMGPKGAFRVPKAGVLK